MRFILKSSTGRHSWLATGRSPTPLLFSSRLAAERYRTIYPEDAPFILVAMSTPRAYKIARLRYIAKVCPTPKGAPTT